VAIWTSARKQKQAQVNQFVRFLATKQAKSKSGPIEINLRPLKIS